VAKNHVIRALIGARLITKGWLTPGALGTGHADRAATFTTTMRMVSWGHRGTTNFWTKSHMACASGFAELDVAVFHITDLTDRGAAFLQNQANLARGHTHMRILAFFCQQLCGSSRGATNLGTLAGMQFNRVDRGANRNVRQGKIIPGADFHVGTRQQRIANFDADRGKDVAFLAISID